MSKPRGRKPKYGQQERGYILEQLSLGRSLRSICREEGMPSETVVREWAQKEGGFTAQYARARDLGMDSLVDEILEIADTCEDPQIARVMIDARKWLASKLAPKRYGDKLDLTHSGGDKPITKVQLVAMPMPKRDKDGKIIPEQNDTTDLEIDGCLN